MNRESKESARVLSPKFGNAKFTHKGSKLMNAQAMKPQEITRVISVTSGKGGVGKTHTAANIAISLANLGKSVLLLDGDLSLANLDLLLNLKPKGNLHDVLKGKLALADIILEGPGGVSVIPASSGIEELSNLSSSQRVQLLEEVENVAQLFDYLLVDTSAGIGQDVMHFNSASSEIVCVVTPEPTSLTDTYALIKVLGRSYGERSVWVTVNQVSNEAEALQVFNRLAEAVERFLNVETRYLGFIPTDASVHECVMRQRPIVLEYPSNPVSRAITSIASRIDTDYRTRRPKGGMQMFFKRLLEIGSNGEEATI